MIFTRSGIIFTRFESDFHSVRVVLTFFTLLKSNHCTLFTLRDRLKLRDLVHYFHHVKHLAACLFGRFFFFFFYFRTTGRSKKLRGHAPSLKSGGATGPLPPPPPVPPPMERLIIRMVIAPKILIPKCHCSERFLIRKVFIPNGF